MSHHNTAFHQLLQPLSRHEFEELAKEHHRGQKLRAASRWDQFIGMSMSQLSGRQSLRDIESSLLRVLQMSLFERKPLRELLNPVLQNKREWDPQMRIPL